MRKLSTAAIAAAVLVGASALAMAQTSSSPSTSPSPSRSAPSDSASGLSGSTSAPMNESQVKQKLESDGYTNVQDIRKDRDGWTAKAMHNGNQVSVNVDSSGKIETR